MKKRKKYEKHKINGSEKEAGETPATLAAHWKPHNGHPDPLPSLLAPFRTLCYSLTELQNSEHLVHNAMYFIRRRWL